MLTRHSAARESRPRVPRRRRSRTRPGRGETADEAGRDRRSLKPRSHRCAKASQGALSPAPAAPSPPPPSASVPRAGAAAREPREPVHTRQPLAGVCACPAPRRPTPRRVRRRRAEPQAHPDARRTFHEPRGAPGTDEERARGVLHSFGCHVTAGNRHPLLIAHTQTCVVYLNQGVKVSKGVEAVGNGHRGRVGHL